MRSRIFFVTILSAFAVLSCNTKTRNTESVDGSNSNVVAIRSGYLGCWNGMRGGRLKITAETIRDEGSGEESPYKELDKKRDKEKSTGLQTGEEYLIEAENDFPKSFLAKIVRFSFHSDGSVGIITYASYADYLKDTFEGQGLFEKMPCT